ncbi:type II toxin-antitoxin system HicB family antitoxin [Bacteroides sp. 519]|uniref:type II toxin-antitoxin system HicB family antitoxin n=1 Tax=Bacteroides sp. 519 TaxID=2302937 RepID=UPI0013D17BD4|nr:type II toxin-antitoxin system HicB family antitoxin [Bacteroides sp. 519]NDV59988.1 type II toxin-antitoxin system HicB family antitoxin [Bacteroides sp. 519]
MGHLKYRGYTGSVEYSEADNCLFGKVLGMTKDSITYEGSTIEELKSDFEAGIDSYLEMCERKGVKPRKAFSGTLNIRIPSEIHGKIAMIAEETGTTVNTVIRRVLEKELKTI